MTLLVPWYLVGPGTVKFERLRTGTAPSTGTGGLDHQGPAFPMIPSLKLLRLPDDLFCISSRVGLTGWAAGN